MEQLINSSTKITQREIGSSYDTELVLSGEELEKTRHNIERGKFLGGSYYAETMISGAPGKKNEDSYAILPMGKGRTLFALLDGATSQKKNKSLDELGMSGAFYISHLTSMRFPESQDFADLCRLDDLIAKDILMISNRWIFNKLQKVPGVDYSDVCTIPGMAAAFVLVDVPNQKMTVAQVADTCIALIGQSGGVEIASNDTNAKFDAETMAYASEISKTFGISLAQIRKHVEANELLHAHLRDSFRRKINTPNGCGILNGMSEMERNNLYYTNEFKLDGRIKEVLLYSDGATQPYTGGKVRPEEAVMGLHSVFNLNNNGNSVIDVGISILDNDPDFVKIPRLKHRDDSTVIKIDLDYKGIRSLPLAG